MRITVLGCISPGGEREYRVAPHSEELFGADAGLFADRGDSRGLDARIERIDEVKRVFAERHPYSDQDDALRHANLLRQRLGLGKEVVIGIVNTGLQLSSDPSQDRSTWI